MIDIAVTSLIIIEHVLLHFPLVLGAYCAISLMKVPDLSLEAASVSGAIIGAQILKYTNTSPLALSVPLVFIGSILGGCLVGLTSSMLTCKARLPHLLSSILTMGIFHGVNQYLLGTSNMSISSHKNMLALIPGFSQNPELPQLALITGLLLILFSLFFKTQLGISLAIHGNNPKLFASYGISRSFIFISGVLISNGLAGFAGFFDASSGGFVDINMGSLKALFCLTALILGKTLVRPKQPISLAVPFVGTCAYFTILQLLLKVGFNLKYFTMVQSFLVLCILVSRYKHNRQSTDHLGV